MQDPHLPDDVKKDVGHGIDRIGTIRLHSSQVDKAEVGVGIALLCRDSHLRWLWMVIEFHPEASEQLICLFWGEGTLLNAPVINGPEVLVKASGIE